jgi:hypothetical protein
LQQNRLKIQALEERLRLEMIRNQIADPAGRTVGILSKPGSSDPSNVVFGGSNFQTLYATSGDKVFRRPTKKKGTFPWVSAMPPRPRL